MSESSIEIWSLIKILVTAAVAAVLTYLATRKKNRAEISNMEIGGFVELRKLVEDLAKDVATLQREKKELEKRLILAEKAIEDERKTFKEMLSQKDDEIQKLTDELKNEKDISTRQQQEINDLRRELEELKEIVQIRKNGRAVK